MKSRFSTVDIAAVVKELDRFLGMRVQNIYDVDNKTYLIRLAKPDMKAVLLMESGIRLHSTEFDWPKNPAPSGFSMKMRKHLKGRRFESVHQLGVDRIVDLQFGSSEAAYHVILELYDRGNIVLTDYEYTILNILRPRTDNSQDVRFAVRETYPVTSVKEHELPTVEKLTELMVSGKDGDPLKKLLVPNLDYGPAILDHCLKGVGFTDNVRIGKGFSISEDMPKLLSAIEEAEEMLKRIQTDTCQGYITQRRDTKPNPKAGEEAELLTYEAFHPFQLRQDEGKPFVEFPSFDRAVDMFFSQVESQRLDMKTLQQEKSALKKLDNVKKDHEKRLENLQKEQETDILKGQLIEMNLPLVDQAILIVRSALANQIDWAEIWNLVKEAQMTGDPVANAIKTLKLDTNHAILLLRDPYEPGQEDVDEEHQPIKPMRIDIDLSLSAYANSRKYFEKKRQAAKKEQKTIDASKKAFKSAEKKTKQTLKEAATIASINKTRKTYWFEKFLWFISSENYLVIGGRDQQQNELIVKRYLRAGDLYVHADLHGASSCVIKNPTGQPVPPKTLNEAGTMAICNSAAWDAKVVTSAWYVHHDQVSKTAPSGEYLTTGSFMIRGKKNYLPPSYLVYGFGFMFKLEEGSVARHKGERRVRTLEEDEMSVTDSVVTESDVTAEESLVADDSDDSDDDDDNNDGEDKGDADEDVVDGMEDIKEEEEIEDDIERVEVNIEDKEDETETGTAFPDTSINLLHVKGDKYELQRGFSTSSTASGMSEADSNVVYLGDNQPVVRGEKVSQSGGKFSAKQRREMRKARKGGGGGQQSERDEEEEAVSWLKKEVEPPGKVDESPKEEDPQKDENEAQNKGQNNSQGPLKRGQKGKQKKMKEKYRDQDEEERQLRMEILASAGSQEKRKKGKKGKDPTPAPKGRPQSGKQGVKGQGQTKEIFKVIEKTDGLTLEDTKSKDTKVKADTAKVDEDEDEEQEAQRQAEDVQILDSLSGCPVGEDEILYAIPVCAPYNTLTNYKYKVKLLPGNTKRGKAVKAAVNVFLHDKTASSREKDLLRILKDVDLSRNMPGKVKVSAPHLHRKK